MTNNAQETAVDKIQQLLLALGKAYLERQQYSQAFDKFQQLLNMGYEDSEVTLNAAEAAIALQDVSAGALELYEKAATLNPTSRRLRQLLEDIFSQFAIATPFALEMIQGAKAKNEPEENASGQESFPEENHSPVSNEVLERLWRQGKFDEAINLLQPSEGNNGHDASAIDLALTHAYQAIAKNEKIVGDKTANLILNGLEMISPAESLRNLRNYLTLRLALPELEHQTANSVDESQEYEFILGLVSMEDFFGNLKNSATKDGFILSKFDVKNEILDILSRADVDHESNCSNSWQSILVAVTQDGRAIPDDFIKLINATAHDLPDSCVRLTGDGFISFARDPLMHIEWLRQLLKRLVVFNRSFHDSYLVNLNCGFVVDFNSKTQDHDVLKDLVAVTHLLKIVGDQKSEPTQPSTIHLIADADLNHRLRDKPVGLTGLGDTALFAGHSATCFELNWFNPLDFLDQGHPCKLADFLVEERLADNADYCTFVGMDRRLGRQMLFKVIPPHKAAQYLNEAAKKENLFARMRAIGRLNHQNIATLFDIGDQDRMIYFVREYLAGKPITEVEFGEDADNQIVTLLLKIVRALMYAQNQGIHHLNLKPANIWVNDAGVLKITDFYCAEFSTRGNEVASTKYVAPEILAAASGDEGSDIFAIGIIVEELLARRVSDFDQLKPHWHELLGKATHNDPSHRFQTLTEFEMELRGIQIKLRELQPTSAST